jgi:threonine/homoserine/homoserine lactone efflux protein
MPRPYHGRWEDGAVPETVPEPGPGAGPRGSLTTVLGSAALVDLLTGVVLAVIGVRSDVAALAVAGVVLLLSGAGVLSWVAWRRNRPEVL